MSGKLMENALKGVRKRFMDTAALRLSKGSTEYCTVQYRTKMLFDHTVRGGKNARASLSLDTFLALNPEASELEKNIMAECAATLEMVQGFYLIVDDIMDGSERRRQKPCWYKMPDIGLSAVNDAFLLDAFTNEIIRELYASHPNLEKICESYRKSKQITLIGQLLDTASIRNTNGFTWERYEQLVQHKTSHYSYFHPMEVALIISDRLGSHPIVRKLAYQIGFLFQSQDDMLDVFGDPSLTGKDGTDIKDGKCTWISVRAVEKLRDKPTLESEFKRNYGRSDEESISKIKSIFDDLNIKEEFTIFEKRFSNKILEDIRHIPRELSPLVPVLEASINNNVFRKK